MSSHALPIYRRLAVQLGFVVALSTALVFGATGWLLVVHERDTLTRELTLRILAETRSLSLAASAPLLRTDPELGLHPLILKALEDNPDLVDLVVLDEGGLIQGHRELQQVDQAWEATRGRELLELPSSEAGEAWMQEGEIVISQPINHLDQRIGTMIARASRRGIEALVRSSVRKMAIIAAAGSLVAMLLTLLLLTRKLSPLGILRDGMEKIGDGRLDTRIVVRQHNELGLLARLLNKMAGDLSEAQGELIQKERLDRELEIAGDLQSMLLPRHVASSQAYVMAAHYTPAREVSGDYYDTIPLSDGSVGLVAADVSGKGVPGLVVMAMLRVVLRGLTAPGRAPRDVLCEAQSMMEGTMGKGMFVTCMYGVLNPNTNRLTYASAGHCPPVLFDAGGVRMLEAGGKAIGMFKTPVFANSVKQYEIELDPGQSVLWYTDGLQEAMDSEGEQLGMDAVLKCLHDSRSEDTETVLERLVNRVEEHRAGALPTDDLTLLLLRRQVARTREVQPV